MIDKKTVIELRGVEFHNKGAELMLYAILERLRLALPDAIFVMETRDSVPISKQRAIGIKSKYLYKIFGVNLSFLGRFLSSEQRSTDGFVLESEIDVVLDGSGFAFGDFWGADKAGDRLANHIVNWKRSGKKIIMLSQAFGDFQDKALREKMKVILDNADLIFARDTYSKQFLKNINGSQINIHTRPDFTNLIKGLVPDYFDPNLHEIGIIPNNKLLESKVFNDKSEYVEFLNRISSAILHRGMKPYFLIHEGIKDLKLAEEVNSNRELNIPILNVDNPLHVKGIIGGSKGIITSRFHGLVSALSQAIPCLCVGWSHKYLALMEDYGYSEGLIKDEFLKGADINEKLDLILDQKLSNEIHKTLIVKSAEQKLLSEDMWQMVLKVIKS